jgi:hypothetical protein
MLKGHLVLRNDLVEVELIEQARAILASHDRLRVSDIEGKASVPPQADPRPAFSLRQHHLTSLIAAETTRPRCPCSVCAFFRER